MNTPRIVAAIAVLFAGACLACSKTHPIREEPVRFQNGSITLAGSLLLPGTPSRHPAVVIFHGSGPQARDITMARWFAEQGIAALTYDKRGVGESTGDFRAVAFEDLCGDGLAGLAMLKTRRDINPQKIGVWGLSQGGWLGPLAASRSKDVAFVIAVSGPGVSPGEQMLFYYASELRSQGFAGADIAEASALRRQVWRYLSTGVGRDEAKTLLERSRSRPWYAAVQAQADGLFALTETQILDDPAVRSRLWFRVEMNYDPTIALRKLSVPSLFLYGEDDQLVPVATSVEIVRKTLAESGASDFTIKVFPRADHTIRVAAADGTRQLAPGYLDTMRNWLRKRVE